MVATVNQAHRSITMEMGDNNDFGRF